MLLNIILSLFFLILLVIVVSAIRNPILRKIGFRNVKRRLGNTFLVILGSMVGTALITGSLVMQDTLEATSLSFVKENVGETDIIIRIKEKELWQGDVVHLDPGEVIDIDQNLLADKIDGVLPIFDVNISPTKLDHNNEPVTQTYLSNLIALDPDQYDHYGEDPPKLSKKALNADGAIASRSLADSLDLNMGDIVQVMVYGESMNFTINEVVDENGIAAIKTLIIDKNNITNKFDLEEGSANAIWVSAKGGIEPNGIESKEYKGAEFKDLIGSKLSKLDFNRVELEIFEIKESELTGGGMNQLSNAFLFLSFFGVFAGIILIINLYSMLAEERRREMGILRAISLTRIQLVKSFIFEGFFYTLIASIVGVVMGLIVGFFFSIIFASMFGQLTEVFDLGQALEFKFFYQNSSLIYGGISGFLVTIVTVFIASNSIGKINIVNAIRGLRENERYKLNWWRILKLTSNVILIVLTIILVVGSFQLPGNFDQQREQGVEFFAQKSQSDFDEFKELVTAYPFFLGVNLLIWLLAIFTQTILKLFNVLVARYSRYTFSLAAIAIIIFNVFLSQFEYVSKAIEYQAGAPIFFLNGTFLVVAAAVLISFNMDIIGQLISMFTRSLGKLNSTFKIALRYPGVNPKRSGLTLIMFAIIIYLIIFISSFKDSVGNETEAMRREFMGDYAIRVSLEPFISNKGQQSISEDIKTIEGVEDVVLIRGLSLTFPEYTKVTEGKDELEKAESGDLNNPQFLNIYSVIGPDTFLESLEGVIFKDRLDQYKTDQDVWQAIQSDSKKIILGYWFDSENFRKEYMNADGETVSDLMVGDKVMVGDVFGHEATEKEIIATVSHDTRNPYAEGIIASEKFLENSFTQLYTDRFSSKALIVEEEKGVDIDELTKEIEKITMGENVSIVMNVDALIGTVINLMRSMFVLFQGFLALSLLIGSSGLAIIIARAAIERKQQIGMLRAIGFQRGMILWAFFVESTLIAFMAIIIGVSMGIVSVENSFRILMDETGMELSYPVWEIILIVVFVYLLSVIFSIWPALKAAKLEPVEATNYPE